MLSPTVYTVAQVAAYLKDKLETDRLLSRLTVQGEVANLRTVASGHSYFSLRENGSALRCVMFSRSSGQEHLEEGQEILAGGKFTFYAPYGEANLQVAVAVPVGAGALALELARLRQQLEAEGLFDPSRKRPLPPFPRVIGVVTSPSGAVWQDIQNVVRRRFPLAELRLSPATVQGAKAAPHLADAVARLNAEGLADVIIVARGGGSLEDLWSFNSEAVARAIFASAIPVVAAVGHETDHTIADDVSDRRAPTPSAAAELVTPDRNRLSADIFGARQQLTALAAAGIDRRRNRLELQREQIRRRAPDFALFRRRIDELAERSAAAAARRNEGFRRDVATLSAQLAALNPAATLQRGYAVVRRAADGSVVTAPGQAAHGDLLDITVAGGALDAVAGRPATGDFPPSPRPASGVSRVSSGPPPASPGSSAPRSRPLRRRPSPAMRPLL